MNDALIAALQANQLLLRELGLRYGAAQTDARRSDDRPAVINEDDAADLCLDMRTLLQEQMRVILLDTKQHVIDVVTVYQGTVNSASVRIAEILRPAILANAPNMIVVHNHPSGDTEPSHADLFINEKLLHSATIMDIDLQDHIIVAPGAGTFSMKRRYVGGFPA